MRYFVCHKNFFLYYKRYLSFSETPIQFPEYPLIFPIQQWPVLDDPSFIGIFYSRDQHC